MIREEVAVKVSSLFDALMMAVEQDDGGVALRASAEQFAADMETSIGAWGQGRSSMGKAGRKLSAGRHRKLVEAVEDLLALVGGRRRRSRRRRRTNRTERSK